MDNPFLIATTVSKLQAETSKHLIETAGIACYIIDKTDSSYPGLFGILEIYVDAPYAEQAKTILQQHEVFGEEE